MPEFEVDPDANPVTLVRFSNGTMRRKVALKSYVREENKDGRPWHQQILTSQVDKISYVGHNFGLTNRFPTDSCDYYMGIHDKTTGKIRVVPASLIQMEPKIKEKEREAEPPAEASSSKTWREKNDALAQEFGSGKSRKAVMKRLKEGMNQEMMVSTAKTTMTTVKVEDVDALVSEELRSHSDAVPLYNINASTPDEVYKLKDIVTREVLSSLTEVSQVLSSATKEDLKTWREQKKYFSYILDKAEILSQVPEARLLQCQCLVYLQYLMEFYLMKAHQLRVKFPLPKEWPMAARDYILNLFSLEVKEPGQRGKRCVPGRLKDLALSHILVLCLKMSEFSLDISPLVTDLKLSVKKLTTHASSLGCITKRSKLGQVEVHTVILKVPLTFPTLKGKTVKNKIF